MKQPNQGDCNKLLILMKYLLGNHGLCITLSTDKKIRLKWYVNAKLAVHSDFNSHTGETITMREGDME